MRAPTHRQSRHGRRERPLVVLLVLALLGWLQLAAGHLHLPGGHAPAAHEPGPRGAAATLAAAADVGAGHRGLLVLDHAHGHAPGHDHGHGPGHGHACALCFAIERGAGTPAPMVALLGVGMPRLETTPAATPPPSRAAASAYRSRAPPPV